MDGTGYETVTKAALAADGERHRWLQSVPCMRRAQPISCKCATSTRNRPEIAVIQRPHGLHATILVTSHTHTHTHTHKHTTMYMCVYTQTDMHTWFHTRALCIHTRAHTLTCAHMCDMHTDTWTLMYRHTYTRTYNVFISIHQFPSISISIHQYPSLSIIVYQYPSTSISIHQCNAHTTPQSPSAWFGSVLIVSSKPMLSV